MKKVYSVVIGDVFNGEQYSLIVTTYDMDESGNRINPQYVNIICATIQDALNKASEITSS
jgi:hypothetical protein